MYYRDESPATVMIYKTFTLQQITFILQQYCGLQDVLLQRLVIRNLCAYCDQGLGSNICESQISLNPSAALEHNLPPLILRQILPGALAERDSMQMKRRCLAVKEKGSTEAGGTKKKVSTVSGVSMQMSRCEQMSCFNRLFTQHSQRWRCRSSPRVRNRVFSYESELWIRPYKLHSWLFELPFKEIVITLIYNLALIQFHRHNYVNYTQNNF